jgi:hypothetical protein
MEGKQALLSAFALGAVASAATTWLFFRLIGNKKKPESASVEASHFDPRMERRGIGTLIKRLNHVALAVSDVGASLQFYTGISFTPENHCSRFRKVI